MQYDSLESCWIQINDTGDGKEHNTARVTVHGMQGPKIILHKCGAPNKDCDHALFIFLLVMGSQMKSDHLSTVHPRGLSLGIDETFPIV